MPESYFTTLSFETPIGLMHAYAAEGKITHLIFDHDPMINLLENQLHTIDSNEIVLKKLKTEVNHYFKGSIQNFNVPIHLQGTAFQQAVWKHVMQIPYGTVLTYNELALKCGGKDKTRAVASANARNTLLLIIPCHRVVGEGKRLTGYRGGVDRKQWLIEFERSHSRQLYHSTLF
jgi:AraC family transcriptional regulator, regulatory protein of adaptative response / methylated-DNA-[protein]-cysteine methyltransferase